MRIIAGRAKGRRLSVPSRGVRPTSDRVREALFSSLDHLIDDWGGEGVLDLFAGTGALGLEALSRGANAATFVERDRRVAAVLRDNVAAAGLGGRVRIQDAMVPATELDPEGVSLMFADPPYSSDPARVQRAMALWGAWLRPGALVVLEGPDSWAGWQWPPGIAAIRARRHGGTRLWIGRVGGEHDGPGDDLRPSGRA